MPHSRNSDAAERIESAVSVSHEAGGDLTKDSIYCTSLNKEQFPPHPGESDPSEADESDIVSVHLSQDESLIVPVSVKGTNLQGVLDCGAGACIMRREIYEALNLKPPVLHRIYLRGVGESLTPGFEIEITVRIGSTTYCGPAYVATMNDDFLLGLHSMKAT